MRKIPQISLLLFLVFQLAWAQEDFSNLNEKLPQDPDVRIGVLKNGLTYYVRNNKKPEDKVDLRLVVKAGSILETDEQLGLAHFMEHMCFNGTKRFPKNTLVDYLQSIGVKFGQHLNAYTSFDETVYFLPIPSDDKEKVNKGFEILEDWAFNTVLTPEEIDKERGVVLEEYRIGLGAGKRMMAQYLPKMMYNSRYADRLPIGKKEIIENFTYDKLISFYEDWYRPNLMSVIVVGDVDPDEMEQKIKKHFSKYKNPKNEKERVYYGLPGHEETFVSVVTDPEATTSDVMIMYKDDEKDEPTKTLADYRYNLAKSLFTSMLNNRLDEKANDKNPPFVYGFSYHGDSYAKNYKAFQSQAMTAEDGQLNALKVLVLESERAKKYGFTKAEFERAKKQMLSNAESRYNEKDKNKSSMYVSAYQNHFLDESPILSSEYSYQAMNHFVPQIALEEVNELAKKYATKKNAVIVLRGPEKEGLVPPTEEEVLNVFNIDEAEITPYEDKELAESLIRNPIQKGSVVKVDKNEKLDITTYTLSNGAKLTVKPTDFKNDEIVFQATSHGGSNLLSNEEYKQVQWALAGLSEAGYAGMNQNELSQFMAGKRAYLRSSIGSISETMSGSTRPKDLEFFMQMVHANFIDLNYDEDAFETYKSKQNSFFANMSAMPQIYFQEQFYGYLMSDNPRFTSFLPKQKEWDETDYKKAYEFYQQQFSNAADFHFFLVGNVDLDQLEELASMYLASLPSNDQKDEVIDLGYRMKNGEIKKVIEKGADPKSNVTIMIYGDADYSESESLAMKAFGDILTIKLTEELRENESGVYGANARGSMSKLPYASFSFNISFPCGPENTEQLTASALRELDKIIKEGPTEKDINKFKEAQKVDYKENSKENNYWLRALVNAHNNGGDPEKVLTYLDRVESLSASQIQEVGKKYLAKNRVIGIHMPEDN